MAQIVIIGAGVTGLPMAQELAELARPGDRITLHARARVRQNPSTRG